MKILRHLSLDVVLGSMMMAYFFGTLDGETRHVSWIAYLVLALSVWLIYTADHLLDAYRITHVAHTPRHKFHQDHFEKIIILACVILVSTTWLTFTKLPIQMLRYGIIVSGLVFLHFGLSMIEKLKYRLLFQKEIRVALVYAIGVSLPTFSMMDSVPMGYILVFVMVLMLALVNLLLISLYEYQSDKADAQMSTAIVLGPKRTQTLIYILLVLLSILWGIGGYLGLELSHWAILGLMISSLWLVSIFSKRFVQKERYRILADLIFVFPLVLIFLM